MVLIRGVLHVPEATLDNLYKKCEPICKPGNPENSPRHSPDQKICLVEKNCDFNMYKQYFDDKSSCPASGEALSLIG